MPNFPHRTFFILLPVSATTLSTTCLKLPGMAFARAPPFGACVHLQRDPRTRQDLLGTGDEFMESCQAQTGVVVTPAGTDETYPVIKGAFRCVTWRA
jgi:hypothetical protein